MLVSATNRDEVPDQMESEIVIVGAGTVGLFMAVSLARANIPVLIVESGGAVPDTSRNEMTAVSVGRKHDGVKLGRSFGLGGTSILWGGQLAEFEPADLGSNGVEWPINIAELHRWYEAVYKSVGLEPWPTERYRALFGGEAAGPPETIERYFTHWLPQPNFAALFRKEIASERHIRIVLNATVNEIEFEESRARSCTAVVPGRGTIRLVGSRFVFATGTIETSRFFLSTQRLHPVPWKQNRTIGTFFQDHIAGKLADVDILDEAKFRDFFENGFAGKLKLQPKLRFGSQVRAQHRVGVTGAFSFTSRIRENVDNMKALARSLYAGRTHSSLARLPSDVRALGSALIPLVMRYARQRRIFALFDGGIEFHCQAEQLPVSESRITLLDNSESNDGLFRAAVNWQLDGRELETLQEFTREADGYLVRHGIARLRTVPALQHGDAGFLETLGDTYHQCGGMLMTSSAEHGVVDSDCRVWNTENVYVAGACVFPTSSSANCTLTALALAARMVSHLNSKHR